MVSLQECVAGADFLHIVIGQCLIVKAERTGHSLQDLHALIGIDHIRKVHHKVHVKLHRNDEITAQCSGESAHTGLKSGLCIQHLASRRLAGILVGSPT